MTMEGVDERRCQEVVQLLLEEKTGEELLLLGIWKPFSCEGGNTWCWCGLCIPTTTPAATLA